MFSELQPITNLTEHSACLYRAETSITADLRNPSTTSGEIHLSGEQSSTALTQSHLEQSEAQQKLVPVPLALRRSNEDDNTRIMPSKLSKRKYDMRRVPVPSEHRLYNEDEHTLISSNALFLRKYRGERVPVPSEHRLSNEDEHTLISYGALQDRKRKRKSVPVPPEYRLKNEDEHTLISLNALNKRKQRKLKSVSLTGEKPHVPRQVGETSAANTLTDSHSAKQNSPILTRSPSGLNASTLHETTPQGAMKIDETIPPFESETAFSHWLDDLNAQQSAIDYIQNCHW
ncbi:MAG: hypothetical protein P8104_03710 [Gammaproteobacteria bacterium]